MPGDGEAGKVGTSYNTKMEKFINHPDYKADAQKTQLIDTIGPRPIVNAEIKKYNNDISYYYRVRPGIAGLWQVSGRSDIRYPGACRWIVGMSKIGRFGTILQ